MKLATLFSFMGIEMTIKGDVEYQHGIKLEGLDIIFHKPETPPTSEEMENAAVMYQAQLDADEKKRAFYANIPDEKVCILALVEQVSLLADAFERPQAISFIEVRNKIQQALERYKNA